MAIDIVRCRQVAEAIMRGETGAGIDLRIFEALGYDITTSHGRMGYAYRGDGPIRFHGGRHWGSMTRFTSDLQQAVTWLLPPGWRIAEMRDGIHVDSECCAVSLWCPAQHPPVNGAYAVTAPTPAAAVCAAALLAYADGVQGWED